MSRITSTPPKPKLPWVVALTAPHRLALTLLIGAVAFAAPQPWLMLHTRLLIGWNAGTFTYLVLGWLAVARADATMTRVRAQIYDQTNYVIFLLVIVASTASVVAIGFLVGAARQLPFPERAAHLTLSILALLLSWLLIHTLFAFHYARCFYWRDHPSKEHVRGLRFPGETEPDYLDFVYYSFVVGMTAQVSDVGITDRTIRRTATAHGIVSFVYNTALVALMVNIAASAI